MRRILALALTLAVLLSLSGCVKASTEEGYDVYYISKTAGAEAALAAEKRSLPPDTEPVEGLLTLLLTPPESENLAAAIPEVVTLRRWTLENGLLTVDFSGSYGILSGIDLTLADYCVVLTMTQLEEVEAVVIMADGDRISYRDHQRLTAADVWSALGPAEDGGENPE